MSLAEFPGNERQRARSDHFAEGKADGAANEASVTSSLEHLVIGSQGVITKRVDLALLEGRQMLSRAAESAALGGMAVLLATGAWFAATRALVLFVVPQSNPALGMAVFALLNAASAMALLALAAKRGQTPAAPGEAQPPRDATRTDGRH